MTNLCARDEYERIAPVYDVLVSPFVARIREDICRLAMSERFGGIIDICCGTGQQAVMLSKLGLRVTGVDLSPSMLSVARLNSPPDIEYFREDAANLHFDDHSFDCAIISFALHEKEAGTRGRILGEAKRVVTRNGKIIVADFLSPHDPMSWLSYAFINMVERVAGAKHHDHFRCFMRSGALETLLRRNRLKPLAVRKYALGMVGLVMAVENGVA